ncbi:MAG: hypothetical protein WDN75_20885, partial [Bacteroidota bacterium]
MNIKSILTCFLIITLYTSGFGQKIKYKDLFVLLNARQFDQAEPFLKKYLKENDDNPNAYLFMGLIYQEKAAKMDLLKDTRPLVTNLDSAVYFFDKAKKSITEKELSRNDEYYQMYNRRDLRTGKFGVTLSDVQLDLENRMKLKERGTTILTLKAQFGASQNAYTRAQRLFLGIQRTYGSQKEFFLKADDKLKDDLILLSKVYDSCHMSFNDYKATSRALGKTAYNQDLDPQEIRDLKKDGASPADFYHDDLKLWDYKRWALESVDIIDKEITPLREQLVALDVQINEVQQKLKKDSVSVGPEIKSLRGKMSFAELRKIDPNPMPLRVFEMKLSELDYGSRVVEDRSLRDSSSVTLHIHAIKNQLMLVRKLDSLAGLLTETSLEQDAENYKDFITKSYGTTAVLISQVKATKDFAIRDVIKKEQELNRRSQSLRWIVNASDSIPLFMEVATKSRFRPLVIVEEKFTAGIQIAADSSSSGYFYTITPSRKPVVKANYPVEKLAFRKRNLPFVKALGIQDEKGLVYFLVFYSEVKVKEKLSATIVKIYKQEGLAWSINYGFDQPPAELVFHPETFELSVKTKSSLGEFFVVTFDKTGKLVKQ